MADAPQEAGKSAPRTRCWCPRSVETYAREEGEVLGWRLPGLYARTLIWFFLGMALLWVVGVESIYDHPTPFYALFSPAFSSALVPGAMLLLFFAAWWVASGLWVHRPLWRHLLTAVVVAAGLAGLGGVLSREAADAGEPVLVAAAAALLDLRWHLLAFGVFLGFFCAALWVMRRVPWFEGELPPRATRYFLGGLVLFAFCFPCVVAMLRGGPAGIWQAYAREAYEYYGDIGVTSSIRQLFARYSEIHSYLSLHARAAPPGPIAVLWLLSYVAGRTPLGLSLATVAVASLAVLPLYGWARELLGKRAALTAAMLYTVVPSIVLFSATSAEALFTPVTLTTLFLFERAIRRNSARYAVAAGLGYGAMSLLKFTLIGVGVYFGLVGLWMLRRPETRRNVIQTAALMAVAALGVHLAVYLWSGFDVVAVFFDAKRHFDIDQYKLDQITPRFPGWAFIFIDPFTWFYYAGIPVSVLFLWRVVRPSTELRAPFTIMLLTLAALDVMFLSRGEGERSALYVFPFLVLPAAHAVDRLGAAAGRLTPFAATAAFLAFQCWLTETYFYTYW